MSADRLSAALADRYRIEHRLGAGGMATVWLARDLRHDREVAIKVLHPELGAALGAERFLSEIKTTARLAHPHLLGLLDSGTADGLLFYVMPYVRGESLRARLVRESQLPVADALRIARDVADALAEAHAHGIVHRDIKPENILLQGTHALVADFGIALAVQQAAGTRITQTGVSLGTPQYMAPEQAIGDRTVDHRADIYALAAVLYEMLSGEPPHTGPTAQAIITKLVHEPIRPVTVLRSAVPEHVDLALSIALERLPADRFSTMSEFAQALDGVATERVRTGARPAVAAPDTPWPRAHVLGIGGALAATALLLGWTIGRRAAPATNDAGRPTYSDLVLADFVPGVDRNFDLSPDGRTVAWVASTSSGVEVRYRRLDDGRTVSIAASGNAGPIVFSRDGAAVAYRSPADERIWTLALAPDARPVRFAGAPSDGGTPIAWTAPDTMYAVEKSTVTRVVRGAASADSLLALPDFRAATSVRALPDGRHLLIASADRGTQIRLVDLVERRSTRLGDDDYLRAFPVDGERVVLATADGELFGARLDLEADTLRGTPVSLGRVPVPFFDPFTVARTGDLLAMRGDSTQAGLRIVALDGSSDRILPYRLRAPRFSPDGRLLAGTRRSGLDEAAAAIWLYDFERDALRAFSDGGPNLAVGQGDGLGGWLGDGRTLHFSRSTIENGELSYDIFRQDADATEATPWITGAFQQRDLATDARGTVGIYRVRETGKPSDLWIADLRGSTPITAPLVDGPDDALHPTISPDGRWFAYASDRTGTFQVFACTLVREDRRCQQVSTDGGTQPKWLRTGDAILFRRGVSVMRVSVATAGDQLRLGRVTRLFDEPQGVLAITQDYDVSPDGTRAVFEHQGPTDRGQLVQRWAAGWPAGLR